MRKVYDLCVKVGSYTDRQGNLKAKWQNIGAVMTGNDKSSFILLDRTFNPAGVPIDGDNTERILINLFKPKESSIS